MEPTIIGLNRVRPLQTALNFIGHMGMFEELTVTR